MQENWQSGDFSRIWRKKVPRLFPDLGKKGQFSLTKTKVPWLFPDFLHKCAFPWLFQVLWQPCQISSYAILSMNVPRYTYKPNLVTLGTFSQKLLSGQARFGPILTVFGPNDLEVQGQISPYAIPSENFPRYIYKPNLVILGTFFQKLSSSHWRRTDNSQTDEQSESSLHSHNFVAEA